MNKMDFYPFGDLGPDIRQMIYLIFSVCVGLPAFIWALRVLSFHTGRISVFILLFLLLISDFLQLVLNLIAIFPYLNINFFFRMWSTWNLWGLLFHQLVALEGILTLKYPQFSACIYSLPCYIITTIPVIVFFIMNIFNIFMDMVPGLLFTVGTSVTSLCLLAVSFTITCAAPPTPALRSSHLMFTVAMVTFVMLYFPFMLVSCLHFIMNVPISWNVMSVCLLSLRVISDPLLCVLVCRKDLRDVQTPETHTEPKADQTAG